MLIGVHLPLARLNKTLSYAEHAHGLVCRTLRYKLDCFDTTPCKQKGSKIMFSKK